MTSIKTNFGTLGEKVAAKYLKDRGYEILDVNWKNNFGRRVGEIDIIAREKIKNELVFVEVKTRELQKYEHTLPEENVGYRKLQKLQKIANIYITQKRLENIGFRFDAISVWLDQDNKRARIKHIEFL